MKREEAESELEFLGLLIMENKLKPVSTDILQTLNDCKVRTIMATGDNVLTAISVARQCKMIDRKKPVYLGEITTGSDNKKKLVWNQTSAYKEHNESVLSGNSNIQHNTAPDLE